MPIEFSCACGKGFKVADEYAGKRSKCTACGQPVVVPAPTPAAAEESAEDAAMRALLDGDDPAPAPRTTSSYAGSSDYSGSAPRRADPPAPMREDSGSAAARALASASKYEKASTAKAKKAKPSSYGSSYDAPPERRWSPHWLKVGGGLLSILIGGVLLAVRLMAGRFSIWGAGLVLIGIFGIINGLLSRSGDA